MAENVQSSSASLRAMLEETVRRINSVYEARMLSPMCDSVLQNQRQLATALMDAIKAVEEYDESLVRRKAYIKVQIDALTKAYNIYTKVLLLPHS